MCMWRFSVTCAAMVNLRQIVTQCSKAQCMEGSKVDDMLQHSECKCPWCSASTGQHRRLALANMCSMSLFPERRPMSKNENLAFSSCLIHVISFLNVTASDSSSCSSMMLDDDLLITAAAAEGAKDNVVHGECL